MYKYVDRRNKRSNPARLSSLYFCSETEREVAKAHRMERDTLKVNQVSFLLPFISKTDFLNYR